MLTYAGIGSRTITDEESNKIQIISNKLSQKYILYSGNCIGSDIAFQKGSNKRCVIYLPYLGFYTDLYSLDDCLDWYDLGQSKEGRAVLLSKKYYDDPSRLYEKGKCYMSRNYHQVMGHDNYPVVSFVVCCADRDSKGNIKGGTGYACRIAEDKNIPVINIRDVDWMSTLNFTLQFLKT